MRYVSSQWQDVETGRQRAPALLFHIFAKRGGRVSSFPAGWGSWTYSTGFTAPVNFTDLHDYAGDGIQSRTYVPAAIEFAPDQVFRNESTSLDPHQIELTVDPALEPFADYVNRRWPLTFGIVIYKVHRAANNTLQTADDNTSAHNQVPVVDVVFVGYLDTDDTLDENAAGLEKSVSGQPAQLKFVTKWDHITKVLDRLVPRPVFSIDCPKVLFSTGPAAIACNADMPNVQIDGVVAAANGVVVSAREWGGQLAGWFAQGLFVYTATDPVSGLPFEITLNIMASAPRTAGAVTYGDLTLEMFPPLPCIGAAATAYGGCDRTRNTCIAKHVPAGSLPAPAGTLPGWSLEIQIDLTNTTTQASNAHIVINGAAGTLSIIYFKADSTQVGGIQIGLVAWDPTWVNLTTSTIETSPAYALSPGMPALPGYTIHLVNAGASGPNIQQQPKASNGYTLIVGTGNNAGSYDFTVSLVPNTGVAVTYGNLQNFGGTDIPIEHPSLETTQ
jgi:hypothetical protein